MVVTTLAGVVAGAPRGFVITSVAIAILPCPFRAATYLYSETQGDGAYAPLPWAVMRRAFSPDFDALLMFVHFDTGEDACPGNTGILGAPATTPA